MALRLQRTRWQPSKPRASAPGIPRWGIGPTVPRIVTTATPVPPPRAWRRPRPPILSQHSTTSTTPRPSSARALPRPPVVWVLLGRDASGWRRAVLSMQIHLWPGWLLLLLLLLLLLMLLLLLLLSVPALVKLMRGFVAREASGYRVRI